MRQLLLGAGGAAAARGRGGRAVGVQAVHAAARAARQGAGTGRTSLGCETRTLQRPGASLDVMHSFSA